MHLCRSATDLKFLRFVKQVNTFYLTILLSVLFEYANKLWFSGVMVRARQSQFLMHHKFVIIDGRLLINGSFNWTSTATFGNWENVTITTVPEVLIQKYADHFELLWTQLCS